MQVRSPGCAVVRAVLVDVLAPPVRVLLDVGGDLVEGAAGTHAKRQLPRRGVVEAAQERQLARVVAREPAERLHQGVGGAVRLGVARPSEGPLNGLQAIQAGPHRPRVVLGLVDRSVVPPLTVSPRAWVSSLRVAYGCISPHGQDLAQTQRGERL